MDASGHHHAPIALLSRRLYCPPAFNSPSPRKEPLIPIEKETEWTPERFWALKKEKNLVPLPGMDRRVILVTTLYCKTEYMNCVVGVL